MVYLLTSLYSYASAGLSASLLRASCSSSFSFDCYVGPLGFLTGTINGFSFRSSCSFAASDVGGGLTSGPSSPDGFFLCYTLNMGYGGIGATGPGVKGSGWSPNRSLGPGSASSASASSTASTVVLPICHLVSSGPAIAL